MTSKASAATGRTSPTFGGWLGPFKSQMIAIRYLEILKKSDKEDLENRVSLVGKQTVGYYSSQNGWFIMPQVDCEALESKSKGKG